jgi:NAD(P)-dependent dehydrogenase (short-subunit alcohol dehydrogenase family)
MFLSLKHEIRAILATGDGGAIVNIASTNSFPARGGNRGTPRPSTGSSGSLGTLAVEYAPLGIRVSAICPGGIDTPTLRGTMARRHCSPEDPVDQLRLLGRFGHADEIGPCRRLVEQR